MLLYYYHHSVAYKLQPLSLTSNPTYLLFHPWDIKQM